MDLFCSASLCNWALNHVRPRGRSTVIACCLATLTGDDFSAELSLGKLNSFLKCSHDTVCEDELQQHPQQMHFWVWLSHPSHLTQSSALPPAVQRHTAFRIHRRGEPAQNCSDDNACGALSQHWSAFTLPL